MLCTVWHEPASMACMGLFPKSFLPKTDETTVDAALSPSGSQGMAVCVRMWTELGHAALGVLTCTCQLPCPVPWGQWWEQRRVETWVSGGFHTPPCSILESEESKILN